MATALSHSQRVCRLYRRALINVRCVLPSLFCAGAGLLPGATMDRGVGTLTRHASGGLQGLRGEPRRFHEAGGGHAGARRHPLRAPPRRPELRTTLTAGRKIAAVHLSGERGDCGRAGKDRARPLPRRPAWPLDIPQNHAGAPAPSPAPSLSSRRSTPNNRPAADRPCGCRACCWRARRCWRSTSIQTPTSFRGGQEAPCITETPRLCPRCAPIPLFLLVAQRSVHFAAYNSLLRLLCRCAHSWNSRNKVRSATPSTPRSHRTPCARDSLARTLLQASLSPVMARVGRTWRGAAAARRAASAHGVPRAPPRSPPAAAPGR